MLYDPVWSTVVKGEGYGAPDSGTVVPSAEVDECSV